MSNLKFITEDIRDKRNGNMFTRHYLVVESKQTGFSFDSNSSDDSAYIERRSNETIASYEAGQYYATNRKIWLRKYRENPNYYNSLVEVKNKSAVVVEDYGLGYSRNYLQSLEEGKKEIRVSYQIKENTSKEDKEVIKEAISFGIFKK